MPSKLPFTTLDVFTSNRFTGNPLAIVHIPTNLPLSQAQKQTIAREFNLSETVFLHQGSEDDERPTTIDIFTTDAELPFAGHPTVGSGWYLLSQSTAKSTVTLRTKAGDIPVVRGAHGRVRLQVPTDFKIHSPFSDPKIRQLQVQLKDVDYTNLSGSEPLVSIVKGMTFVLLQLTSEDALARLQPSPERLTAEDLGEWRGFLALYAFYERSDGVVRTRMFDGLFEDPATGSAASTLGGFLAKKKGPGKWTFNIFQGVEMGRPSEITVVVEIDGDGKIKKIELEGGAVEVMEGSVTFD